MKLHLGKKGINNKVERRKRINKEKKLQGRKEGRTERKPNMNKNKNWGNRKEREKKARKK